MGREGGMGRERRGAAPGYRYLSQQARGPELTTTVEAENQLLHVVLCMHCGVGLSPYVQINRKKKKKYIWTVWLKSVIQLAFQ